MTDGSDDPPIPPGGHEALVDTFPNGVIVLFDADLRYRIVGPSKLPFSDRLAEDMVGRPVDALFPPATVDTLRPILAETIDGDPQSIDFDYDGRVHHLETRPVQIDGAPYGVLVTQEVTAVRETAEALREQNERLDQFASMLSHDLRNPLAIAAGRLASYRETGDEAHLDSLDSALDRIDELTTDLLALVKTDSSEYAFEPVSIAAVARDAWDAVDTREATLTVEDATVEGDEGKLRVLFENLFRNAVGHGGDAITVRVGPLDGGFSVEDTGVGIPKEDRDRVFEHGYTTGYGGSGVGLTIVSRIAEAHDLRIDLTESEEGGARFEFRA